MSAVPTCYYGSPEPPPARRPLRAGPLALEYEAGDLRSVRLGNWEVIRRWYVALRDANWGTVPTRLSGENVQAGSDHFRVEYQAHHQQGEIDFAWTGSIVGTPAGTITFRMDGVARSRFRRNRLGFCLLHPMRECAGARCRYELGNGTSGEGTFPRSIAPRNPFHNLRAFVHEVLPGLWAELRFEGDLFEMEDQRNWTDASFKTFCTPLRLPFPVVVAEGTRVCQTVTLRLLGHVPAVRPDDPRATLAVGPVHRGALPQLGLQVADHGHPLTATEIDRLRLLRPAHLRVDLDLTAGYLGDRLRQAAAEAAHLGGGLELALTVSDAAWEETIAFVPLLHAVEPTLLRVLLFHHGAWATPEHILRPVTEAIARYRPSVPIYAGTTANFAELNRGRPHIDRVGGVCYAAQPQEHAFDNATLIECCATLAETVHSARQFSGDLPIAVTPVTLRKRVNPYATGPTPPTPPGELPPTVDPRQMSLFGAGWTLASLKYLAEGGAASVTYFDTTGWRGVMETDTGCPLPDRFPSQPGMVYPLFHVLADVAELPGAEWFAVGAGLPLRCDGLALRSGRVSRVMLANLVGETTTVVLAGLGRSARVRVLDESTFAHATQDPETFRTDAGEIRGTFDGRLEVTLRPYAYARIDTE
jgi:hypothetical protein